MNLSDRFGGDVGPGGGVTDALCLCLEYVGEIGESVRFISWPCSLRTISGRVCHVCGSRILFPFLFHSSCSKLWSVC